MSQLRIFFLEKQVTIAIGLQASCHFAEMLCDNTLNERKYQSTIEQNLTHSAIQTSYKYGVIDGLSHTNNFSKFSLHQLIQMLKNYRKGLLSQKSGPEQQKTSIQKWVEAEINQISDCLSDSSCRFYLNPLTRNNKDLMVVEMYVCPQIGVFQEIEFRPKMYLSSVDIVKRPKIYNDRRIYHPNLNLMTQEIVFPELCADWNPTKSLQILFKALKYVLIEPNISFVPNNPLNTKAGLNYLFKRSQFRQMVIQQAPMVLQSCSKSEKFDEKEQNKVQPIQEQNPSWKVQTNTRSEEYCNVENICAIGLGNPTQNRQGTSEKLRKAVAFSQDSKELDTKMGEDQEFLLLSKKIKKIGLKQQSQQKSSEEHLQPVMKNE